MVRSEHALASYSGLFWTLFSPAPVQYLWADGGWEERRIQGLGRSCDDRLFLIVGMGKNELVMGKGRTGNGNGGIFKDMPRMVRSLSIIYLLSVSSVLSFFLSFTPSCSHGVCYP